MKFSWNMRLRVNLIMEADVNVIVGIFVFEGDANVGKMKLRVMLVLGSEVEMDV